MELNCTQCGAGIPIEEETTFLRCPYCETALYIERDRTVRHYYMTRNVAEKDIAPQVQRRLSQIEITKPVKVLKVKRVYFPFWRIDTSLGGTVTLPAATPLLEDMANLKMPSGDLKLYSESVAQEKEMEEPTLLLEDALMEAKKTLGGADDIKFTQASIVHLPLLKVSFELDEEIYNVVVEGVSGTVYADDWPAAPAMKKDRALAYIAVLAFALFFLEAAFIPWFLAVLGAYLLTAGLIYFLAKRAIEKMEG